MVHTWEEIESVCDLYDNNPNLTLKQLSNMTGYSIPELKEMLTGFNYQSENCQAELTRKGVKP